MRTYRLFPLVLCAALLGCSGTETEDEYLYYKAGEFEGRTTHRDYSRLSSYLNPPWDNDDAVDQLILWMGSDVPEPRKGLYYFVASAADEGGTAERRFELTCPKKSDPVTCEQLGLGVGRWSWRVRIPPTLEVGMSEWTVTEGGGYSYNNANAARIADCLTLDYVSVRYRCPLANQ